MKKYWAKTKKRLISFWSESDLFKKRFLELESEWNNYCMITWQLLSYDNLTASSFPHLLAKWMFREFRYYLNNIWLVKWIDEHNEIDRKMRELKKDIWLVDIEIKLRNWEEIYLLLKKYG